MDQYSLAIPGQRSLLMSVLPNYFFGGADGGKMPFSRRYEAAVE
jgi:hypothetical protein